MMSKRLLLLWLALTALHGPASGADELKITPDVIYGHKAGMALTFDVVQPEQPNGAAILFMMSGGWVSVWVPPETLVESKPGSPSMFKDVLDRGYTLFIVRHGSSPYFKVPDAVADVRRAVRFIRMHANEYKIDPERIGVFGASAGGHLSLMLGTGGDDGISTSKDPVERVSNRVHVVVAIFPPTMIRDFFDLKGQFPALDFPPDQADAISPRLLVTKEDAPTLLIHGDNDKLVPLEQSERILELFKESRVPSDLLVIRGGGHGFIGQDQKNAQKAMMDWFDQYLIKK